MACPSVAEFTELLRRETPEKITQDYVFGGDVFLAQQHPQALTTLRNQLCPVFSLQEQNVMIVGSAKMGFSLDPYNFPNRFKRKGGDIDVIVVSEELFDQYWEMILRWHYPRRTQGVMTGPDKEFVRERQKDLYWGWFRPADIEYAGLSFPSVLRPLLDLKTRWFNVFRSLSVQPAFSGRDVHGRLYRTWDHALWYHVSGLSQIKSKLI